MRNALGLLILTAAAAPAASACADGLAVRPTDPPSLAVVVHAGEVALPGGKRVIVETAKLTVDPPEMRTAAVTAKAPRLYAKWFEPWEPWPKKGKDGKACVINLTPKYDEKGVLILGGLFRAFDPATLKVTSADGSKTFVRGKDYKLTADWGQVANLGGLGRPHVDEVKVTCRYALQK